MRLLIALCIVVCSVLGQDPQTPLQPYCARDDGVFDWAVYDIVYGVDYDTYIINYTSCKWLTPKDTDISLWYNILEIAVPHNLDKASPYGAIYADGGHRGDIPPHEGDEFAGIIATRTGNLVGHLQDIPNQPGLFYGEKPKPRRRTEDALIAYTWSHFLNNSDAPEWLARLPMVKSVKMAMDVMVQFATQYNFGTLSKFAIAGASKRGWTTWLTPACDDRVVAIMPIVMPMGNMQKVINKLWRSLGLWSFALDDYQAMNLMAYLNTANFTKMAAIIDPILYKASLAKIPKFLITASGDEFFIPDAHREFWSDVPGVKYMRVVPNAEHSMAGHAYRVIKQISVFLNHLKNNTLPGMSKSQLVYSNTTASITVWPAGNPSSVTLWQATTLSSTRRDFRLIVCDDISKCINPVIWYSSSVPPSRDGSYTASVSAPSSGWTGFMLEVAYGTTDSDFIEFTTEVNIVPDVYPFPPCGQSGGCNPTDARDTVRESLKFRKPLRQTAH